MAQKARSTVPSATAFAPAIAPPEMIGEGDQALRGLRVFERRCVEEVVGVVDPGHSLHERSIRTPILYQIRFIGTS